MKVGMEVLRRAQEVILEDLAAEEMDQVREQSMVQTRQPILAQVVVEAERLQELETQLAVKAHQALQLLAT
jgi:hypothetical protein